MKCVVVCFLLCLSGLQASAQIYGFKFGVFGLSDLSAKSFPLDTTASAIVLNEFGHAWIDNMTNKLIFDYHVRIRILKNGGLSKANFEIPIRKNGNKEEVLVDIQASTFNIAGIRMEETKWDKKIFTEDLGEYYELRKFTLPDVRVGSVIELMYTMESPFLYNFREWSFQDDIPKLRSEFNARIPGNYVYNTVLKGPLKLSKNNSTVEANCFELGTVKADCANQEFGMIDIPAFKTEPYMTARSNFLASLNYELSEVRYFDGRVDRFTKEWKDVDEELRHDEDFGLQLKKGRNLMEDEVKKLVAGEKDQLKIAKTIFRHVASTYTWDERLSKYSKEGVKKIMDVKKGNVADINLLLIATLQAADLKADPVILSTRENGMPIMLHPVLSDFNYVVALLDINGEKYFLDATEKYYPFGLLPQRCLNGKGRLIGKESMWVDLLPREKRKETVVMNLNLDDAGVFRGAMSISSYGYLAAQKREMIRGFADREQYVAGLQNEWRGKSISNYQVLNLDDLDAGLIEQMDITIQEEANMNAEVLYLDPFFAGKTGENPFKSDQRSYPVDFGAPLDRTLVVNITHPEKFRVEEQPGNVSLALPQSGGRFLFSVNSLGSKISISSSLVLSRTLYGPTEYQSLRELFTRIIQTEQSMFVFTSKK